MGWIECVPCEKFWRDFIALFGPFCIDFRAVIKRSEMHQNMTLGSNGVDRLCSLRNNPRRLCCTSLCTKCASWARFASIFMRWWNGSKRIKIGVLGPMWWIGCLRYKKYPRRLCYESLFTNCTSSVHFAVIFVRWLNGPKRTKTWVYGPMGWISGFVVKNFNMTSLVEFVH
jgi:hypothetical protein